jgi:hypothetical protein
MRITLLAIFLMTIARADAGDTSTSTSTFSTAEVDIFHDTPVTQQVNTYSTRLIARTANNTVLYDQTFNVDFSDPAVQTAASTATSLLLSNGAQAVAGPTLRACQEISETSVTSYVLY